MIAARPAGVRGFDGLDIAADGPGSVGFRKLPGEADVLLDDLQAQAWQREDEGFANYAERRPPIHHCVINEVSSWGKATQLLGRHSPRPGGLGQQPRA